MYVSCYGCGAKVWINSADDAIQYLRPLLYAYCDNCMEEW